MSNIITEQRGLVSVSFERVSLSGLEPYEIIAKYEELDPFEAEIKGCVCVGREVQYADTYRDGIGAEIVTLTADENGDFEYELYTDETRQAVRSWKFD